MAESSPRVEFTLRHQPIVERACVAVCSRPCVAFVFHGASLLLLDFVGCSLVEDAACECSSRGGQRNRFGLACVAGGGGNVR